MSLFNLSPALTGLSDATVIVNRPSVAGYNTDGTAAATTNTVFTGVSTSFQSMRGDDLKHVPEGDHVTSWRKIWPQMVLQVSDRIVHPTQGTFVVQELDESTSQGGFSAAYARKLGDGES